MDETRPGEGVPPPLQIQQDVEKIEYQVRELRDRLKVDSEAWNATNDVLRALDRVRQGSFWVR